MPSPSISLSQTSPMSSSSMSSCPGFGIDGQLSSPLGTPSPSISVSQASPIPSPSLSFWSGLKASGQLSAASPMPSPLRSRTGTGGSSSPPPPALQPANPMPETSATSMSN